MLLGMNASRRALVVALFFLVAVPLIRAEDGDDLDAYKWRVAGMWWFSHPTGNFRAASDQVSWDLNKDFAFGNYSTFTGSIDWHFKKKHHLLFSASPIYSSRAATLSRDITFRDVTYAVGARVSANLNSLSFAPGYQYDIIRRDHGYLAVVASVNLLDTKGALSGTGTLNGVSASYTSSASVFAPLPVVGPKFRWYPLQHSSRFSVDGMLQGMYFFGYGDFLSTQGTAQVELRRHLSFRAGYQLGTRLSIHGSNNQVGVRLTQQGPVAGLEASW